MGRIGAGVVLISALLVLFQNCGKAGFENQEMIEQLSVSENVDPKFASLPFPYQISVNQIAHMSCPLNLDPQAATPYFSWNLGAYDNAEDVATYTMNIRPSGMQLSPQFLTEWDKLAKAYNPTVVKDKLKEFLMTYPALQNAKLMASFRKTNLPKTTLMTLPAGGDTSVFPFLSPLASDSISDPFKDNPNKAFNYFPGALNFNERSMAVSMIIPSVYGLNNQALRANYDSSFLSLGLGNASDVMDVNLLGPSEDPRYAYGKGFRVRFGVTNPHSGTIEYPTSDSLVSIEEHDLETGSRTTGVGWDCKYKFKIVQTSDRYKPAYRAYHFTKMNGGECPTQQSSGAYCASPINSQFGVSLEAFSGQCPSNRPLANGVYCEEHYSAVCPDEPHSATLNHPNAIQRLDGVYHPSYPERPAILHALRRFLPADKWDINVSRGCIVPKMDDNACYGSQPVVYDEYFFTGLNTNPNLGQYAGCGVAGQYQCAAYLTMCVRR